MTMRVWTCTTFEGHHPVGTAAVVVAVDEAEARYLLNLAIAVEGLPSLLDSDELVELDVNTRGAVVLRNGDY